MLWMEITPKAVFTPQVSRKRATNSPTVMVTAEVFMKLSYPCSGLASSCVAANNSGVLSIGRKPF